MRRLFIGFDLPSAWYGTLYGLRDEQLPVRWTPPENMHVTLHFLGTVAAEHVASIETALRTIEAGAYSTTISGVIAFPRRRNARIIAADVESSPRLLELHQKTGSALRGIGGFQPESRPYNPHVTIGRVREPDEGVERFIESTSLPPLGRTEVLSIALFESHLEKRGARYERVVQIPLR